MRVLARLSVGASSQAFAWLPPIGIAVLGWIYVSSLAESLLEPDIPISVAYKAEQGEAVATISGLRLDPWGRKASAARIEVRDTRGRLLARVKGLEASLAHKTPVIRIKDVWATVTRKADGSLDLGRLLPKAPPPDEEAGLSAKVDKAVLDYRDEVVSQRVQASLAQAVISQGAGHTQAKGIVQLDSQPPMPLDLSIHQDGRFLIGVRPAGMDAAPYSALLQSWLPKEALVGWKGLSASSLKATGRAAIEGSPKDWAKIKTEVEFSAVGLTIPGLIQGWTASGEAALDDTVFTADAVVVRPGARLAWKGAGRIDTLETKGSFELSAASRAALWPEIARLVPREAAFTRLSTKGVLTSGPRLAATLEARAASAFWGRDGGQDIQAQLHWDGSKLRAVVPQATALGRKAEGWVEWEQKGGALKGFVRSESGSFHQIADRFGLGGLDASGEASLVLGGTAASPALALSTRARGRYVYDKKQDPLFFSSASLRADITKSGMTVKRLEALTPSGLVEASGSYGWDGRMNLQVSGSGIGLDAFHPDVTGTALASAQITGTAAKPEIAGRFEAYDVLAFGRSIPVVQGLLKGRDGIYSVSNLSAQAGTGAVLGSAQWNQKSDEITGAFTADNLLISDWVDAGVLGSVSLTEARVSGTLAKPKLDGRARTSKLSIQGTTVEGAEAAFSLDNTGAAITGIAARVGPGTVSGTASLVWEKLGIQAALELNNLPLSHAPLDEELAVLKGTTSGKAAVSGTLADGRLRAEYTGVIDDLEVNATPIGSGDASLLYENGVLTAKGEVGSLERFLTLSRLSLDFDKELIDIEADLLNFQAQDFALAAHDWWKDADVQTQETIRGARGQLSSRVAVKGSLREPDISLESGQLTGIRILDRNAGRIDFSGSRKAGRWEIGEWLWADGDARLKIQKGTYSEAEGLDLIATLDKLDLSWINSALPAFTPIAGTAETVAVALSGPQDSLSGQATVYAKDIAVPQSEGRPIPLVDFINLPELVLENGVITARNGQVSYRGFTGSLSADLPLAAFGEAEPEKEQPRFQLDLGMNVDDIRDLAEYIPALKGGELKGRADGRLRVEGVASDWDFSLNASAKGTRLSAQGLGSGLNDFDLAVTASRQQASVKGRLVSDKSGSTDIDVQAALPDLAAAANLVEDVLELSNVQGRVAFNQFRVDERLQGASVASGATLNGAVTLGGSIGQLVIGGNISASGSSIVLPSAFKEQAPAAPSPYEPRFNAFQFSTAPGTTIKFGLGQLAVSGSGRIDGPLSALNVRAPLSVDGGQLRLPNARIALESGGRLDVRFEGDSRQPLRINVDMEGSTVITARRALDLYETYDVTLLVRGDLLDPNGLNLTAQSDPGDLSQAEILAILGQRDLIQALAGTVQGGASGLRDPLYQLLVPNLTDPLLGPFAKAFGLSYLRIDFNTFDQAVGRFGKDLGAGFFGSGWWQLSEPPQGRRKFDFRVTYRLPVGIGIFDRFRLGLGTNQDRPWRITLDWARRF